VETLDKSKKHTIIIKIEIKASKTLMKKKMMKITHTHFTHQIKNPNNLNVNHGYLGSFYDEERNNIRKGMKSMFIVRHQL